MFRADFTIGPAAEVSLIEYTRLSLSPQFSFEKVPREPYKRIFWKISHPSTGAVIDKRERSIGCFFIFL